MAVPQTNLTVFRNIMRELRRIYGKKKFQDVPAYAFLKDQYRKNDITSERYCRDKLELTYQAHTYLLYLQSARKHLEIAAQYKGSGERGIEETAKMVGFNLPTTPTNEPK